MTKGGTSPLHHEEHTLPKGVYKKYETLNMDMEPP